MICRKCGVENKEDSKFCMGCGSLMEEIEQPIQELSTEKENIGESIEKEESFTAENQQQTQKKKFCQNCGSELIPGLKFCGECGAPATGGFKVGGNGVFSDMGEMIKLSIKKPSDSLKKACDEKYAKVAVVFLIIKNIIIAALKSATLEANFYSFFNIFGDLGNTVWSMSGWNGFQAFMFMFLLGVIVDAIFIFMFLAAGKMFGSRITLKEWIGTFTSAVAFPAILMMAGLIFSVLGGMGILLYSLITMVSIIIFSTELTLGFAYSMKLHENNNIYAFMVGVLIIIIIFAIITAIIGGITAASIIGSFASSANELF